MEVRDLKDLFFILGVLVSIVFVLGIIMISVIKLHDFIAECKYAKRYEYMINHRFDDPRHSLSFIIIHLEIRLLVN